MYELIAAVSATVLSLALSLIPGLRVKWAELPEDTQKLGIVGIMAVAAIGIYLVGCFGLESIPGLVCGTAGIWPMVKAWGIAILVSQGIYKVTPLPGDVKAAREYRDESL